MLTFAHRELHWKDVGCLHASDRAPSCVYVFVWDAARAQLHTDDTSPAVTLITQTMEDMRRVQRSEPALITPQTRAAEAALPNSAACSLSNSSKVATTSSRNGSLPFSVAI